MRAIFSGQNQKRQIQNQNATPGNSGIGVETPGQQNQSPPKITDETINHIIKGKVTENGISGCHNKKNFLDLFNQNQDIFTNLKYEKNVGFCQKYTYEYNGQEKTKTVYDGISDEVILKQMEIAVQVAHRKHQIKYEANGSSKGSFSQIIGGITYEGFVEFGEVTSIYPVI